MADLILYGLPMSPFARKAEVVLREKGLDYDFENVNFLPSMPDWFAAISPARRVPVLRDCSIGKEGRLGTIPDSSAICAYLDQKMPEPGLYGSNGFERGRVTWIEEYADTELGSTIGMSIFRPLIFPRFEGKPSDVEAAKNGLHNKCPRHFDYLESELSDNGDYFVGAAFSLADIAVATQIAQLDLVSGPPDAKRWPRLVAHYAGMKARPSFMHNLGVCEKIMPKFLSEKVDLSA